MCTNSYNIDWVGILYYLHTAVILLIMYGPVVVLVPTNSSYKSRSLQYNMQYQCMLEAFVHTWANKLYYNYMVSPVVIVSTSFLSHSTWLCANINPVKVTFHQTLYNLVTYHYLLLITIKVSCLLFIKHLMVK